MFFHELAVGSEFIGPGRTLTEADLSIACMVSGDWHPIHSNEDYAKERGLPGRLFQGSFGILIATGMATQLPHFSDEIVGATGIREMDLSGADLRRQYGSCPIGHLNKRVTSDGRRAIIERTLSLINQKSAVVQEGIAGAMVRLSG